MLQVATCTKCGRIGWGESYADAARACESHSRIWNCYGATTVRPYR